MEHPPFNKNLKCPKNHSYNPTTWRTRGEICLICKQKTWNDWRANDKVMYRCDCRLFICVECASNLSEDIFHWNQLCKSSEPPSAKYYETPTVEPGQQNAVSLLNGYFRENCPEDEEKDISYDIFIGICLMYYWNNYKLKKFYDKHHNELVTPETYHLRPLVDTYDVALLRYVLKHSKSKYINNCYKYLTLTDRPDETWESDQTTRSLLWQLIYAYHHDRSNGYRDIRGSPYYQNGELIASILKDYDFDIQINMEQMFHSPNVAESELLIELEVFRQLCIRYDIPLHLNYVDQAIENELWTFVPWLINNGCKITQKCYDIYFVKLLKHWGLDLKAIDADKNAAIPSILAKAEHHECSSWRDTHDDTDYEPDTTAAIVLLYHKFDGDIDINYVNDAIKCRKSGNISTLRWLLDHDARVDKECWRSVIDELRDARAVAFLDVLFDKQGDIEPIKDYMHVAIQNSMLSTATWLFEHGADKSGCFEAIFKVKEPEHYWSPPSFLDLAQKLHALDKDQYKDKLGHCRDMMSSNMNVGSKFELSKWMFELIHPEQSEFIMKFIHVWWRRCSRWNWGPPKEICLYIFGYMQTPQG